jgi:calcineurin-like phosphoesterase family protein
MPKAKSRKKAQPSKRHPRKPPFTTSPPVVTVPGLAPAIPTSDPLFGEPTPSSDPTRFLDQPHDSGFYKLLNKSLLQPIPPPTNSGITPDKLVLSLEQALGSGGPAKVQALQKAGMIVFHSAGDTGPTKGPATLTAVVDKMNEDFNEVDPADVPSFFYHLGDVIYNFGEDEYYYDQFYEPFRDYQAPVFAIPGNHDGMMYKGQAGATLEAFLRNFCADNWRKPPEAGGLPRTTMIQPAVYFTLDAPFVKIIGLYSNVLEGPGVVSDQGDKTSPVKNVQLDFLKAQLNLVKKSNYKGALIVAVHHPPFTAGTIHGGSPGMLKDLDTAFQAAGVYPHAILSGHAHNYQRFTRTEGTRETPYIVAGSGGHAANAIRPGKNSAPIRTPLDMGAVPGGGTVRLETYFPNFGYLRVVANSKLVSFEFHEVGSGLQSKSPIDSVTVDLQSHTLTTTRP